MFYVLSTAASRACRMPGSRSRHAQQELKAESPCRGALPLPCREANVGMLTSISEGLGALTHQPLSGRGEM